MMHGNVLIKKFMQKDLSGFFVISIVSISLLFVYSLSSALLLPAGVNAFFASILWKILLGILALCAVFFSSWMFLVRKMGFSYKKKFESFKAIEFIFILIPMTPVMQYILSNQDSLNILSSCIIFGFFAFIAAVFGIVIPVLFSRFAPKNVLINASISYIYLIVSMASFSAANAWSSKGNIAIQLMVFAVVIVVLSARKWLPAKLVTAAIVVFFAVNTLTGILFKEPAGGMPGNVKGLSIISTMEGKIIKKHNDVLFIVFEGYSNSETMKHYGFDNNEQIAFLGKNGFHIYQGAYSLGAPTEQSLSKTFNIDADITEHKKYLAGSGAVHALLSRQGYKTYGVFDNNWNLRGLPLDQIKYDLCFPRPSGVMDTKVLINAILTGEFSDAVSFEGVSYDSYVNHKRKVITKKYASPVFMYSHSSFPGHSPSGKGMGLDEGPVKIHEYIEGIKKANIEMQHDVEAVRADNPDAIIVIAGDHGPFMTKTGYGVSKGRGGFSAKDIDRYDVQDRFGAFLAIRWPEKQYAAKHDIRISQDIFPAIFSYLFDDDTLFNKTRLERVTRESFRTLGVYVKDGRIVGGKDDGQELFLQKP